MIMKMLTHVHKIVITCWCCTFAKVVEFEWLRGVWGPLSLPPSKLGGIQVFLRN
jgi:hypothetical protein